jgi:hypothetical protein
MEFRWVAIITLWTFLSGPIFGTPSGPASTARKPRAAATASAKAPVAKAGRAEAPRRR